MKFLKNKRIHKYNCGVNEIQNGGEYTFCGCAIPDSVIGSDFGEDFEREGNPYKGTIKDITCPECKKFIVYVKSLEVSP
jgi:hypothetical protein